MGNVLAESLARSQVLALALAWVLRGVKSVLSYIHIRALRPRRVFAALLALSLSFQRWRDEADEMLCEIRDGELHVWLCGIEYGRLFGGFRSDGTDRRV